MGGAFIFGFERPLFISEDANVLFEEVKEMKKTFAILALAIGLLPGAPSAQEQIVIGMTVPGLQFPFFVTMKAEAEETAAKLGIKLLFTDAQNSSDKQMAAMERR